MTEVLGFDVRPSNLREILIGGQGRRRSLLESRHRKSRAPRDGRSLDSVGTQKPLGRF